MADKPRYAKLKNPFKSFVFFFKRSRVGKENRKVLVLGLKGC